jgi:hypothetical protein
MQFSVSRHRNWVLSLRSARWGPQVKFDSYRVQLHKFRGEQVDGVGRGWTAITQPGAGRGQERQAGALTSRDALFSGGSATSPSPYAPAVMGAASIARRAANATSPYGET